MWVGSPSILIKITVKKITYSVPKDKQARSNGQQMLDGKWHPFLSYIQTVFHFEYGMIWIKMKMKKDTEFWSTTKKT